MTQDAAAGVRVLHLALSVPGDDADVKLAVENAGADRTVAADRGVRPALAGRALDALAIDFASSPFRLFVDVALAWKELRYDHCLSRAANPIASSALDA